MNKNIFITLVLIVVLSVGFLIWQLWPTEILPDSLEPEGEENEIAGWDAYINKRYGFQLRYPGAICRDLDCVEWKVREEIFNGQPRIIVSPKEKELGAIEENSTVQIYPEGLATGLLFISDDYLRKEEKTINGFSASVNTYLTEEGAEFQWFVRFIDRPWNWSEHNYVFASAESDLGRKCGGLSEAEVEDLDRCVEGQGWTLSGLVNEEHADIIRKIISTIEFIDIDFSSSDAGKGEKSVRWTPYVHFNRLDEIELLLDEEIKNLTRGMYGSESSFYCQI